MTSISKQAADTTNSVLATISTAANTVTNVVTTTGQAVDMLSSFITTARTKQIARTAIDLESFYDELADESAIDAAERQNAIVEKLNANPVLKQLYTENHSKFSTVLNKIRNPNT